MRRLTTLLVFASAALIAGCGARTAAEPAAPSPTIAAAAPREAADVPTPTATRVPERPSATAAPASAVSPPSPPSQDVLGPAGGEAPFAYLWPEYLPSDMEPAPAESRIARDGELGPGDIGFFVVTFNGGGRKLVIGGGAAEALPLTGRITAVALGERGARLVTSDDQRQLTISGSQGSLFVYGVGIAEDELVRVAESLRPIDVAEMRRRVGGN